ncbi:hypothetical protein IFM89_027874 [Coptis chinensis]|uniref:At3g05675-like ankyrin-like domain-containing protein n=1 Tax=Coptis chinensis TaxID=261450 RepID=A0A835HEP3_9MAGN|nr:hypothetical protein IFM89_027874 [Coptis chinensis]
MAAESILRSKQVSAMIKQGFISNPSFSFSPKLSPSSSPQNPCFTQNNIKPTSSSTLYEMMSEEQQRESKQLEDKRRISQERVSKILDNAPFQNPEYGGVRDVKLCISSRDGFKVSMNVHRSVLIDQSRFFKDKLKQEEGVMHSVEICDCDEVEVYVETVVLMYYSDDLNKRLVKEDVGKVLGLLKVFSAIKFDMGIISCLDYLEAVPWSEDEEEKVVSVLGQLQLHGPAVEVLQRVSAEPSTSANGDDIFMRLLSGVLEAKDDKARREMKALISGLLREDATKNKNHIDSVDVSSEILYQLCDKCLSSLLICLSEAESTDESRRDRGLMSEIGREADNLQWIVDIMIEKKLGDEFVKLWADQKELASLHSKMPTMYRYEISRVTAQLCVAIGRGQILVSRDARFSLLCTWLEPLYEDFGWMKRACRSLDKKLLEDGLSQTILTLPLQQQQVILLNWFNRFLNKGDDCPNIQRAFQVWWRRAFIRQYVPEKDHSNLQITVCDYAT